MRFSLGYYLVSLLLALALANQAFAAVYRPSFHGDRYDSSDSSDSDSDDETCDDSRHEEPCRLKAADDADCYLELVPNRGWLRRSCPDGALFSERNCGCSILLPQEDDSSSDEDCDEHRNVPCTRKPTHDRSSYLQFIEGKGWKRQSCPKGTAYSAGDCACSIYLSEYHSSDDSSSSSSEEDNWGQTVTKLCTREQADDRQSYLQMVRGHGWMQRHCAKGTVYNAQTCRCSMGDSEDDSSDSSCEDDDSTYEWDGRCLLKPASSQNHFRQFAQGHGWITRRCPKGTGFSADDCVCTMSACSDDDDSSSSEEDSWSRQSYGNGQNARSGYDDSSSSSSEEDRHSWSHRSYGKGPRRSGGYGDSSSDEDESSWNTYDNAPCTRKPTHDRRSYLQFVEGKGWKRQPCPKGTAFSAEDCACSITVDHEHSDDSCNNEEHDHSWSRQSYGNGQNARSGYGDSSSSSSSSEEDGQPWSHHSYGKDSRIPAGYGDSSSEEDGSSWNTDRYGHGAVPCTRKPTHDRSSYMQFVEGKGWKRQPCPKGTAFSAENCACSVTVAHGGDNDDSSSSSSEEYGHSWSQQSYGEYRTAPSGYGDDSSSSSEENDEHCEQSEPVPCTSKPSDDSRSYLQLVEGRGWVLQSCADGTAYSASDCSCTITLPDAHLSHDDSSSSSEEDENCEVPEPEPCTREPTDDSRMYLQMVQGHGWVRQNCAKGTAYDAHTCLCSVTLPEAEVSDSSCEEDTEAEPWNGQCTLKAGSDITHFLQYSEGHGYKTQRCPKGTGFSEEDCGCTVSVSAESSSSSSEEYGDTFSYGKGGGDSFYGGSSNFFSQSEYSPPIRSEPIPEDLGQATNNVGTGQEHVEGENENMAHIFGQALQGNGQAFGRF